MAGATGEIYTDPPFGARPVKTAWRGVSWSLRRGKRGRTHVLEGEGLLATSCGEVSHFLGHVCSVCGYNTPRPIHLFFPITAQQTAGRESFHFIT